MKNPALFDRQRGRQALCRRRALVTACIFLLLCCSCAQVPKESVELSATVGRDIVQVYKSHRQLAVILYDRIKNDINRFVDEVYAPYQIHNLLTADQEDFKAGNPDSLFAALDAAIKNPDKPDIQKTSLEAMDVFLQVVRGEVESYRTERLGPVLAQEKELLSAIDRSYNQIHYANSIVIGHLASVVKVYDAQEEILNQFGHEGLREEIGQNLAATSNKVAAFVEKSKNIDLTIKNIHEKITELTEELDSFVERPEEKKED